MNLKRWFPFILFLLFVLGIIAGADSGRLRWFLDWVGGIPLGDKVGHVFLIGTLAFLLNAALSGRVVNSERFRFQLGGVIVFVLITVEEFSQIWIPSRTFDLKDLAANYIGIFCAEMLARWLRSRLRRSEENGDAISASGA